MLRLNYSAEVCKATETHEKMAKRIDWIDSSNNTFNLPIADPYYLTLPPDLYTQNQPKLVLH